MDRNRPVHEARPRVLVVLHSTQRGGAERMGIAEIEHLAGDFDVLVSAPPGPLHARIDPRATVTPGMSIVPLWGAGPLRWTIALARTARDAIRLARRIRREGIAIVVTNSAVCLGAALGARLAGIPSIVHARDWPASRLSTAVFATEGWTSTVIAISARLAGLVRGRGVIVIPDGIPLAAHGRVRTLLSPPIELLQVGGLDPRKGQDVTIDALARLRANGIDASASFAGRTTDADYVAGLRSQVERLGLVEHVRFLGEVPAMDDVYARADVAVSTATGEWTPLWLMEALSWHLPIVACDAGSVADIVIDGETGMLVSRDADAIAGAVARLLADPQRARALAGAGDEHIRSCFDLQVTLDGLTEAINACLERQRP